MQPRLVRLGGEDATRAIQEAAALLRQGRLLGLPTETVYGLAANATDQQAVGRLIALKGRPPDKPMALALHSRSAALRLVPNMGLLGRRITKRCWPGPLTIVFAGALEQELGLSLPAAVRPAVSRNGDVGVRVPSHWAALEVLRLADVPVALTSANRSGQPAPCQAEAVAEAFGDSLSMVLDDGTTRHGTSSTVVRIDGDRWRLLREGVVPEGTVKRLAARLILFVCTGNTCRSPMAEGMCKALLAERLDCRVDQLPDRGYVVMSAGVAAGLGSPASLETTAVLKDMNIELDEPGSQPLTSVMADQADHVFAMTEGHRRAVIGMLIDRDESDKVQLLDPDGGEIPDPLGGTDEVYARCAAMIRQGIENAIAKMLS